MNRSTRWTVAVAIVLSIFVALNCGPSDTTLSPSLALPQNLSVGVAVKNIKFGTAIPSDFVVAVAGGPTPITFGAPDDEAALVSLPLGATYIATVSGPGGYAVAHGAECSGVADTTRKTCQITLTEQPMSCDDALWTPVYLRDRLRVLDACQAVSGFLADVGLEPDGDLVMELIPDPPYAGIMRPGNRSNPGAHGHLIVEIPCQGPTTEAAPRAACASFAGARIPVPAMGSHIVAAAHWVEDLNHSAWGELHGARILPLPR